MFRAYRFNLHPTPEQEALLFQSVGVCRLVYNLALEQRRDFWRQYKRVNGRGMSFGSQCAELTALRAEVGWIAAVNRVPQEQALRDLDRAFVSFFAGRKKYPKPRRRGQNDSFRVMAKECRFRALSGKWGEVTLPKLGRVRYRATRPLAGDLRDVTVIYTGGSWYISVTARLERDTPVHTGPAVGIDRGVTNTLALSTGEILRLPETLTAIAARVGRQQRALARAKRGSKRRARRLGRIRRLHARATAIRRDFSHRAALSIAERYGVIGIEDLDISRMTVSARGTADEPGRNVRQKAGLNRAILRQGWGQFANILSYKAEERGGRVVTVPAPHTSQTCAACGVVDARSRESQAVFRCVHCGHEAHADTNAAVEILRRSISELRVEGGRQAPVEARTIRARARKPGRHAQPGDADSHNSTNHH